MALLQQISNETREGFLQDEVEQKRKILYDLLQEQMQLMVKSQNIVDLGKEADFTNDDIDTELSEKLLAIKKAEGQKLFNDLFRLIKWKEIAVLNRKQRLATIITLLFIEVMIKLDKETLEFMVMRWNELYLRILSAMADENENGRDSDNYVEVTFANINYQELKQWGLSQQGVDTYFDRIQTTLEAICIGIKDIEVFTKSADTLDIKNLRKILSSQDLKIIASLKWGDLQGALRTRNKEMQTPREQQQKRRQQHNNNRERSNTDRNHNNRDRNHNNRDRNDINTNEDIDIDIEDKQGQEFKENDRTQIVGMCQDLINKQGQGSISNSDVFNLVKEMSKKLVNNQNKRGNHGNISPHMKQIIALANSHGVESGTNNHNRGNVGSGMGSYSNNRTGLRNRMNIDNRNNNMNKFGKRILDDNMNYNKNQSYAGGLGGVLDDQFTNEDRYHLLKLLWFRIL